MSFGSKSGNLEAEVMSLRVTTACEGLKIVMLVQVEADALKDSKQLRSSASLSFIMRFSSEAHSWMLCSTRQLPCRLA